MKVLLAGGGSGGHVTPLKAIADELRLHDEGYVLSVITNREFEATARKIFSESQNIKIHPIFAGKLRRYHSKSLAWHFIHLPTLVKNIRDILYLAIGCLQAIILLLWLRPDVVFCKGGFVCVPVGVASRLLHKRLIIHDSDTRPGLTNRLLSRWARVIATGMPAEFYPYEPRRMAYTGIPVQKLFAPISSKTQITYKKELGFSANQPVLLITGGGNGADSLNKKISSGVGELLQQGWGVIHLAGRNKSDQLRSMRESLPKKQQNAWHIEEFADMAPRLLAADVVMARTSASTLQECANAKKTVIGVPSPHLVDQQMNATYFASKKAIITVDETAESAETLINTVLTLYGSKRAITMARNLHSLYAHPDASAKLANIITTQIPR